MSPIRLTCPNCGAEYEPPANMIPSGGRYVQCSACGTRWFAKAEGRRLLSEDQIIAKLEARGPNLRLANEPLAEPSSGEGQSDSAGDTRVEAANPDPAPPDPEKALDLAAPRAAPGRDGSDFAWESPEPLEEPKTEKELEKAADFAFEEPESLKLSTPKSEETFTWEEPAEEPAEESVKPDISQRLSERADQGTPQSRPNVSEASQRDASARPQMSPLRSQPTSPRPQVVHPRIVIQEAPRSRFWHGFGLIAGLFAALTLLYFGAVNLSGGPSGISEIAATYVQAIDTLRISLAGFINPGA
ncbi:MAG: zinc-ribbon domain-containing protein [Pseudomonadota bacterium]